MTDSSYPQKEARVKGRQVIVQRTSMAPSRMSMGMGVGGGSMIQRSARMSFGAPAITGQLSQNAASTVNNVIGTKEKEKKEMSGLNDRLANYLEKVAMMEAQNKMLMAEIERLKKLKGFDAKSLRDMYENELNAARDLLKKAVDDKNDVDCKLLSAEDKLDVKDREIDQLKKALSEMRNKVDKLNAECSDYEAECAALRRNAECYEMDIKRLQDNIDRLKDELERTQTDLGNETLERLKLCNESQSIQENLEFEVDALQKENEMLREMLDQDNMPKMKAQMQGHFKEAMNSLRAENEDALRKMKGEYELMYESKLQQLNSGLQRDNMDATIAKEETKKLKSQMGNTKNKLAELNALIAQLRAENEDLRNALADLNEEFDNEKRCCQEEKDRLNSNIDALTCELERLQDKNLDLDLEIKMYSRLLDGKEGSLRNIVEQASESQSRGGAALSGMILESGGGGGGGGFGSSQQSKKQPEKNKKPDSKKPEITMSESMGTLRIQRRSECPIAFVEHETDGSCVKIANTTKKPFQLKGWRVERDFKKAGQKHKSFYVFGDCLLNAGQSLLLWSKDSRRYAKGNDVVCDDNCLSWGSGDGCFHLLDVDRNEKATCDIHFK